MFNIVLFISVCIIGERGSIMVIALDSKSRGVLYQTRWCLLRILKQDTITRLSYSGLIPKSGGSLPE